MGDESFQTLGIALGSNTIVARFLIACNDCWQLLHMESDGSKWRFVPQQTVSVSTLASKPIAVFQPLSYIVGSSLDNACLTLTLTWTVTPVVSAQQLLISTILW